MSHLSFDVRPGTVTGFLGPNGAGKSTTMRLMLGLDRGEGTCTFDGRPFTSIDQPMREVGALLEAKPFHPTRTARNHLRMLAAANDIPDGRVDEVLGMVGLADVAGKKPSTFSLGMGQRLGLAAALLGNPHTLILDEPANGLDPQGIRWMRDLLKALASEGRSVFVSSHLLSEMALMADELVVIGRGRMIANGPVAEFTRRSTRNFVLVRTPQARDLAALVGQRLAGEGSVQATAPGELNIVGLTAVEVGDLAFENQIRVHELATREASLEDAFLEITGGSQEFQAHGPGARRVAAAGPGRGGPPPGQQPPPGWSGPQQGGPQGPPPGAPSGGPPQGGPQQGRRPVAAAARRTPGRGPATRPEAGDERGAEVRMATHHDPALHLVAQRRHPVRGRRADLPGRDGAPARLVRTSPTGTNSKDDSLITLEMMMTQFSNFDPMFYVVAYIVSIIGIFSWGHEYRHGMIRATLTALPQRSSVWTAKYLVAAAWVAVVVVATCIVSFVVATVWFAGLDLDYDIPALLAAIGRRVVYTVLLTWIVMSLTILFRNQTFALVAMYLWPMAIETLIKGIFVLPGLSEHREITRFLPFNAGGRIMQREPQAYDVFGDPLNAVGGFIVFGVFAAALMALAYVLFEKRDA